MKNITRHTGTLEVLERLPSSINGNPRYLLRCGGFTFRTAPDSSLGYSVTNYDGQTVTVTVGIYYGRPTLDSIKEV